MEVLEAIAAVNSVAKLAYLLGSTIYDIAQLAYNSKKIPKQLQLEINSFQGFINLVTTVELSLKHRCPQGNDSPVISYMKTQGVLQQIHTECTQLTDAIACQQNEISIYQAKLGPDPNFGRRVITAIMWKITLGPKTYSLHPMIERLKTSLHLVMNIIHLEAVQQNGLQEEMTHLKEEIRGLRDRLPQIAQQGASDLFPGPWAHGQHFYLANNNTLNSVRQSVVSIFSSTFLATTRGSRVDADNLSILAESMVDTGQVPVLPVVSRKSSRISLRPNSGHRVRRYASTVSTFRTSISGDAIPVPRHETGQLSVGSAQEASVSEAHLSAPDSDQTRGRKTETPSLSSETTLPAENPTTSKGNETCTVTDRPRRASLSPERPATEIVHVQIRNYQGQWHPIKAILDPVLYIPDQHVARGPQIHYHAMVALRVLVPELGWPKDPTLENTGFQELPIQHKFRWGFAQSAAIGRITLTWKVGDDQIDDEMTKDCIITNEDPCDEGVVLKRLPGDDSMRLLT